MATLTHAESRRLYSWWWDSHINPKNSRWLQENLADMDIKVKSMIKLIEEDADSFAKRAEMYYKKRPELMKFVEEFYRAYRALAERYNHATGALRQAHQTMEEAFPNEIPFVLSDESPSESSAIETAPHTPEMPPPTSALSDSHNSQKDSLVGASKFHDITKNGEYYEEGNSSECKLLQKEVSQVPKKHENLKIQITSKSMHGDDAEVEVRNQKETMSKLKSEQDAALHQLQLSLERISNMETEISRCQEEFKKQNDEMLMVVTKLNSAEERCVLLDKVNQALQLDLDTLNQRTKEQQEELDKNQEQSERLNISLQEEHLQAETARLSLEDLHSQSQEEVKLLVLEVQRGIEKLKNMEMYTVGLEEEVRELKEEIGSLNEQILASAFKIINLQDEIIFLKDSKAKLEDELGLHIEEKKVLQREFSCLKEDRYELEQRRHRLTEQIESVNFNVESLHAMVKELQDGNAEVREICRKHEDEKVVHLDNLKHMEKISEKIKTLEESSESLNDMISVHVSEKAVLMSKLESVTQNMEDLSDRNAFLEKSLSDANVELEGLREKLLGLEESCQSQCAQNSEFHSEKSTLVSQIERTTQNLENLETRYAELEGKHLNLEREKDLALRRVMELQDSLKHEREEYETLILSNKPQISTLENQIHLLREESWVREELLEAEQRKIMDAQITIFILQRCLCDMNEKHSILSIEYQKHLVTLKSTEKVILKLNQELLAQEKKLTMSSGCSEKLREGIQLMLRELSINKECGSLDGIKDEVLLQQTLHEVRDLLNCLSNAQDEKQHILLEKLVIVTILEQFGEHLMDVTIEKNVLERESIIKTEELSVVISQLDSAAQSMENLSGKNTFLENCLSDVTVELESLRGKSKELEESCESLSAQNSKLLSEKSTMVSQVQKSTQSLEILEMGYAKLEGKHLNLEKEKDLSLHQVMELQDSLKRMEEEYETLILSSKTRLSTLENQNCLLREETRVREEEFEVEQHKIMDCEIEIFILQSSLCDMNEKNSILLVECQKHLVDENLILELKHELHVQEIQWTMSLGRSEKLREGILQMLRELHISKDCWFLDGMKDEVLLQLTLCTIRGLLSSISDAHDENQLIHIEKSVIVTILEQFRVNLMDLIAEKKTLERTSLIKTKELSVLQSKELEILQMNEQLREDVMSSNQSQMIRKAEMEVLRRQLIDSREAHGTLQSEVCKLLEENQTLLEKNYALKESKDALEEENSIILAEAMGLECLYTIYMSSMEEKALELKSLSDNRASLHGVKKGLDREIRLINEKLEAVEEENVSLKETVVNLEECKRRSMILEDDLNMTRIVCKQLNREIESRTDLLAQKSIELLEANQKLQSTQDENTELCRNLESLQLDIDTAMVVIGELENKIFSLLEDTTQRDNEITYPRQANEISYRELDSLRKEVEELRRREEHLTSELQKGVDEVNSCEVEIATLLNDIHITTVNAAVFQEKIVELLVTCESFEVSAIVQNETLHEGITRRNSPLEGLNEKLDTMEGENQRLRKELSVYLLLVTALWDDITALEELTLSLAKHQPSNHREKQDNSSVSLQHCDSCQEPIEYQGATVPAGIMEFQKLRRKVQALQKVVIDTECLLEQEVFEFNASLEAAMKEIQVLKSRGNSGQEEAQISKERGDARISRVKYEHLMKDIELDILLGSSRYENGAGSDEPSTIENAGSSDCLLELWEATERDCNNQTHKASSVAPVQEIEYYKIEDEERKIELPFSELETEKDPTINKKELPKRVRGSHREWNRKVIERLSFDAQRLSVLQTSVQGLKRNLEASEISNCTTSFGSDVVEAQLNEAEEAILQLIDTNSKLAKKAQGFSPSSDSPVAKPNETRDTSRRQISEQARSGSEKVGRLELELHKIRFILLKLEEEHENKRARGAGRRRVVLRDYLYGSTDYQKQKKGPSCGCSRPKTEDD